MVSLYVLSFRVDEEDDVSDYLTEYILLSSPPTSTLSIYPYSASCFPCLSLVFFQKLPRIAGSEAKYACFVLSPKYTNLYFQPPFHLKLKREANGFFFDFFLFF